MTRYQPVSLAAATELQRIVGKNNMITGDLEKMEPYAHDEVADPTYTHLPEAVVKPGSAGEVSAILKLANRELFPVTPRGGGSGLSGGAVPAYGGIVLSTERMNRILEIDKENMIAVLEPGVITNEFIKQAQNEGLFFAGYPMSQEMCYIGGNVAENAGGGRALKYGVTSRYLTGLEVVLPTGEICSFGGKRIKDVTGYNMVQLMAGSEGTLGIFTKLMLKLLPLPAARIDMMVLFESVASAIKAVSLIMNRAQIIPSSIEFMDRLSLETSCRFTGEKIGREKCDAVLIIELDGSNADQIRQECLDIGDLCLDHGALDAYIAEGPADQEKIWKVRRHIAEAFKAASPEQSLEDIVVPVSNISMMTSRLNEIALRHKVLIPCYGHAGDGNLHATVLKNPGDSTERWRETLPAVLKEIYMAARELGGTISGEHGIGNKRKAYLPLVLSEPEIEAMKSIKRAFDPNHILNPGKIFDLD